VVVAEPVEEIELLQIKATVNSELRFKAHKLSKPNLKISEFIVGLKRTVSQYANYRCESTQDQA
jgi:hypothetical protein